MIKITGPAIVLILTAIFLFLAATNIQAGWLYLVDAFMWSIIFLSILIPFLQYRRLSIKRFHRLSSYSQAPIHSTLEITNTSKLNTYFLSFDDHIPHKIIKAPKNLSLLKQKGFIVSLKPQETYQHHYELSISQRGVYQFTQVEITSFGPFGLMGITWTIRCPSVIVVYPTRPDKLQQKSLKHSTGDEWFAPSYKKAFSNYISHFRDYQPGDNIRYIHWKNSARQNKLVIYEMLEIQSPKASIIVNSHINQTANEFEKLIDLAGKLSLSHIMEGHSLSLLSQPPEQNTWPEKYWPKRMVQNAQSWKDIAHWLAYLEADSSLSIQNWLEKEGLTNQHLLILTTRMNPELQQFLQKYVESHYCKISLFCTGEKDRKYVSGEKISYIWVKPSLSS